MKSLEEMPVLLVDPGGSQRTLDGDCACPVPLSQSRSSSPVEAVLWQIAPRLYRAHLPEGYELLFNYFGHEGAAVLNPPARELLHSFAQPASIAGRTRTNNVLSAVREMIRLGLLVCPDDRPARSVSRPETLTAWLHVTSLCNLACDYCYVKKMPDVMDIEIGKKAVEAVVRSAVANGFQRVKLKYAGGEATLNFALLTQLHLYAARCADRASLELDGVVLTNGVGLSASMIESLKKNHLRLSISMDGVSQTHDRQRRFPNGHGSFTSLERTLDRLERASFLPSITVTVTGRNLASLPETVRYLLKRKLPFAINFYRENDCSSCFTSLRYEEEQTIRSLKEAFQVLEQDLPPYSLLGSLVDRARLDVAHDRPCGVGSSYIVIDPAGRIAKCHMEIEKTITDVFAEDPLSIIRLDGGGLRNLSVHEKEGCRDCEWQCWCSGGCPALTYRATGRFDVQSPNCTIYKALLPEVLRLEGLWLLKYGQPAGLA